MRSMFKAIKLAGCFNAAKTLMFQKIKTNLISCHDLFNYYTYYCYYLPDLVSGKNHLGTGLIKIAS